MAAKNQGSVKEAEQPKAVEESVYTAEELIANYKVFKTSKPIVKVALKLAKKETATFSEAKHIIEKFRNKEVK